MGALRRLHRVEVNIVDRHAAVCTSPDSSRDGTGYPDGLAGTEIPRVARIVRCCDAFSAMTTDRSYRKAMPLEDAVVELRRCSGTDFDPDVVEALADRVLSAA